MKKRQQAPKKAEEPLRSLKSSSSARKKGVRYVECQKNHAASTGGYAVDGCREFMASGEEGTTGALKCAACNCHRSFHRREEDNCEFYHSSNEN